MNNNQNNKILYGIGGIIIGIILVSVFTPMMRYGGFEMMNWRDNSMLKQKSIVNTQIVRGIDRHFIEQMIPHHEGAVDMAKLALKKSKHFEIKTLATAIIEAQTKEIQDMTGWYKDWFGKDVSKVSFSMMGGGMMSQSGIRMGSSLDIDALKNATDFDKEFIEQMIPHHQMAIMMANMLQSGTNRPEMEQLAKNIIFSQSKEIREMQVWYVQWYK